MREEYYAELARERDLFVDGVYVGEWVAEEQAQVTQINVSEVASAASVPATTGLVAHQPDVPPEVVTAAHSPPHGLGSGLGAPPGLPEPDEVDSERDEASEKSSEEEASSGEEEVEQDAPSLASTPRHSDLTDNTEWVQKKGGWFRVSKGGDTEDPRAVLVMPMFKEPVIFANTAENVDKAIEGRITRKMKPFDPSNATRKHLNSFVTTLLDQVFTRNAIWAAIAEVTPLEEHRSSKWSLDRFRQAVERVARDPEPELQFKASIKAEPMPAGKPPRMLIADQDPGQVAALFCLVVLEKILFKVYRHKCLKGRPVREAFADFTKELRAGKNSLFGIEGDGSAWDTCCSFELREMLENRVLGKISDEIAQFAGSPAFEDAHNKANRKKFLRLQLPFGKIGDKQFREIRSIRRSGHRGTSSLNWLTNFTLWHVVLFGRNARNFVDPDVRRANDRWSFARTLRSGYEGDDSALMTRPQLTQEQEKEVMDIWTSLGFEMKLKFRQPGEAMEFCGHYFMLDRKGMTGEYVRDVRRALANGCIATPPNPRGLYEDPEAVRALAAAKATSYAESFREVPVLCRKYYQYAESLGGPRLDEEGIRRHLGGNSLPQSVREEKKEAILSSLLRAVKAPADYRKESSKLQRFGYPATPQELAQFEQAQWDFNHLLNHGLKLPPGWT